MYTSENNWYSWQYGDDPLFGRQTSTKQFKTHFTKFYGSVGSFKDELLNAAKSTVDHFSDLRPSILFSGGIDSEIVLRAYMDIGANPDVYIIRYENDINIMATPSELRRLPDEYEVARYRAPTFGPIIPDNCFLKQELFRREWGDIYLTPEPYVDTYFSLITETICAESPYSFRTEKMAKPLAMGHPFIIASNRGFYQDLHNLGFKTFGHVIDESFDQIDHHQDRMDRIVKIVTDLCQQNLVSFLKECYTVCKYNQQRLAELRLEVREEFPNRFTQYINERLRV
jgi:hypothetical protein